MRSIAPEGFGQKRRDWNTRTELVAWREAWANTANEHLAKADLDIRIDHRSLEAQGIDLAPGKSSEYLLSVSRKPICPTI